MAKLQIRKVGDEALRKVCRPVDAITPRILTLLDDMVETMRAANGVGLAAPQVGMLRRIVVIDVEPGEVIEREARKITVHSLTCTPIGNREYILDVHCSKGTYIRTLLADIGAKLGTGGVMKTLCRTEASGYTLDCAHTLEELEAMSDAEKIALVRPTSEIFAKHPSVMLSDFFSRLAHAGQEIYLKKIGASFDVGAMVRLEDASGFFALGEVQDFDEGTAIKAIKLFRI